MATLKEPLYKYLTATGAVTTDNKAGVLHHAFFSGATVGDQCDIKDGASTILTLLTSVANEPVEFKPPQDKRPTFTTDIDVTITKTGNAFLTCVYEEIEE